MLQDHNKTVASHTEGVYCQELLISSGWGDYALIDIGDGRKLERCGPYLIDRPEPQAMGEKATKALWQKPDAVFTGKESEDESEQGRWRFAGDKILQDWATFYGNIKFRGLFTPFRHLGYFPEQHLQWDCMTGHLQQLPPRAAVLNLFGYTGVASLIAAEAGAAVTHLDASKKAIGYARENMALSGLASDSIRWIVEDARSFAAREVRRQKKYDVILIDPPKFGRGTEGEVWDLFTDLPGLLRDCNEMLKPGGLLILTVYAIRASSIAFAELCRMIFKDNARQIIFGEMVLRVENDDRLLPTAHYVRVYK